MSKLYMGVIIGLQSIKIHDDSNVTVKSKVRLYSKEAESGKKFEEAMYLNFCAEYYSDEDFHDIFIMSERFELHELKKLIKEMDNE